MDYLIGFLTQFVGSRPDPGAFGAVVGLVSSGALWGPILGLLVWMRTAARSGSYLRASGKTRRVYSPPPAFAWGAAAFVLAYPLLMAAILPESKSPLAPVFRRWAEAGHPGMARDLVLTACLLGLAGWGAARGLRRKCVLSLDLERRTYRTTDLSGVIWKARRGPWEDIAGVCVYSTNRRKPDEGLAYYVGLRWRGPSKVYSALGGFKRRAQAEAYAEKAAHELGLPLVEARPSAFG